MRNTNRDIKAYYFPREAVFFVKRELNLYKSRIIVADKGNTKFVAHRGLSAIHRENTLASFKAAGAVEYFGIETDVHVTSDGKYVIIHDDDTARVADGGVGISVENSTFDALRAVKLAPKNGEDTVDGTRIPTLEEYICTCRDCGKTSVLELKNHFEKDDVLKIIDTISTLGHLDKTIFISFDLANCIVVREKCPTTKVQYLTTRYSEDLVKLLKDNKLDVDIYCFELTKKRIDALHTADVEINCWTVDSPRFARKLIKYGVDYITTNVLG